MLKTLIVLGILAGLVWFFFLKKRPSKKVEETMVECNRCGTFATQEECVCSEGKYYCSLECLKRSQQ